MVDLAATLKRGWQLHQEGQYADAEAAYRQAVLSSPEHPVARYCLGRLAFDAGRFESAVEHLTEAIRFDRSKAVFHADLGQAYQALGRWSDAAASYRAALALDANHAPTHVNLGNALLQSGEPQQALTCYQQALQCDPGLADAHSCLGVVFEQLGHVSNAIDSYRRAVALRPDYALAHFNLGTALKKDRQFEQAVISLQRAIELKPDLADAHNNLGAAYEKMSRLDEAQRSFERAIELDPERGDFRDNLGFVLRVYEHPKAGVTSNLYAAACLKASLQRDPSSLDTLLSLANVYNDLGTAFKRLGQADAAIANYFEAADWFNKAAAGDPSSLEAQLGLAGLYNKLGLPDNAIGPSRRAVELTPLSSQAKKELAAALRDQGDMDGGVAALRQSLELDPTDWFNHCNLLYALNFHPGYDASAVFAEHLAWAQRHAEPLSAAAAPHAIDGQAERRLRIGYVSSHFREHAVSFFSEPMIAAHDHDRFEIFCYADEAIRDAVTERFRLAADQWRDITGLPDEATAQRIRQDKIDILVDLAGHIGGNKLLVFARKPAPIQVTYLGYQNTTGMSVMDYRLTDAHADPPGTTEEYYTEKLIRLPRSFFCYAPPAAPPVNPLPARSAGCVTFGSFNHVQKITPQAIKVWAQILNAVPNSRLSVLAYAGGQFERHVRTIMSEASIDPGRVDVLDKRPRYEYLRLFHEIDLALDTFPFNGHTTVCDALWMGVPSIMLEGSSYASRFGGSVLLNVGLEDLIAHDCQEYIEIAVRLATDLDRLEAIRVTSRIKMENSPLMDAPGFTRNLEHAFRQMWREKCLGS